MDKNLKTLEQIVGAGSFMNLREPMEEAGFKVEVNRGDMPMPPIWYELSKDNVEYIIANKAYIDGADIIVGEIAIGIAD